MEAAPSPLDDHSGSKPGGNRSSWLSILVVLLILAGVGLTAYYGVRALRSYRQLHHMQLRPGQTDVTLIRTWMTVPYIARAYRVPEAVLWQGLGIPEPGNRAKNLRALDRQYANGQPGIILEKVKEIITQYQGAHPTLPGLPTPTAPPDPVQTYRFPLPADQMAG